MYTKLAGGTTLAGGAAAAGGGTLAHTGFQGSALAIAAVTLMLAGGACLRIGRNWKNRTN